MFCIKCGKPIPDDSPLCVSCGAPRPAVRPAAKSPRMPDTEPIRTAPQRSPNSSPATNTFTDINSFSTPQRDTARHATPVIRADAPRREPSPNSFAGNYRQPPVGNNNQPPSGNYNQPPVGNYHRPPVDNYNQSPPNPGYVQNQNGSNSYFDGGLLSYIGWKIVGFLITAVTLGICFPWALCMIYGWKINHTVIDGRRLKFTGSAVNLFGHWILWWFLTIITLGIYSFWMFIALEKWRVKNTTFEDSYRK